MTENAQPPSPEKKRKETIKAVLGGLLGFSAYKLLGIPGALIVILFVVLHEWAETRPWARWGSLGVSFVVGAAGFLWATLVIEVHQGPDPSLLTLAAFSASLTLLACSVLLTPFYGIRAALRWRRGGSPLKTGDELMRSVDQNP
jgi:hypothetical protein